MRGARPSTITRTVGGGLVESGAHALAPVPPPAGDAEVVAPHDLAGIDRHRDGLAVGHRVERLVAGRAHEPGRAGVAVEVLAADGHEVLDRDGVVEVGEPVDAREPRVDPAYQRLDAAAGRPRLHAEAEEGLAPGRDLGRDSGAAPARRLRALCSARDNAASLPTSPGPPRTPVATISSAR